MRYTLHEQQEAKSATWIDLGHVEEYNTETKSKPAVLCEPAPEAYLTRCRHNLREGTCELCFERGYAKRIHPQAWANFVLSPVWDSTAWEVIYPTLKPAVSTPVQKTPKTASKEALDLARYFSEPRDLPYDAATEQPAIRDLKYFLPSSTKPLGFLPAIPKQNPRTKAWTLRRRWSEYGKRKEIELYLGRPTSEEGMT